MISLQKPNTRRTIWGQWLGVLFCGLISTFFSAYIVISSPSQALAGSSSSQANTPLIIGVSDWAPYSGYDLPGHGFLTEVIQVAMKRVGYKTIAQKTPWSRVIKGTSRGDIDIIPGIWYSDERAKTILYGTVLATARLVLISRVDHPAKIENIEDLDDLTVGIIQDYAYPSFFLEATNFTKDYSRNLVFNLKKLAKGRIDAALGDELVARYTTDKLFSGKVKFRYSESSLDSKSVFLGISLKNPNHDRILGDFENALAEMKADGTYQKLLEKHGIVETRKSS